MKSKYLPVLAFLAAALLFYWVKENQRGSRHKGVAGKERAGDAKFDRNPARIIYSKHAKCRMDCREIDESEVKEILAAGIINNSKIETSNKGTSYPLEGTTHDGQRVRIVFAPKDDGSTVVVTVIDLDKEYVCDC